MEKRRIKVASELSWVIGWLTLTLSICLITKTGFGVSMVVSPAYVVHLALVDKLPWFTFGVSECFLQGTLLVVLCISVWRFKWQYLLAFLCAVIHGALLDGWLFVFSGVEFNGIVIKVAMFILGLILTGFAISLFFRTYLPLEVYDLFVTELCSVYSIKQSIVKWVYDFSMLIIAGVLALVLFGDFTGIGVGTLVCAVVNSPIITFFGKVWDSKIEHTTFLPKLKNIIER
jgi:uncharacterized membrane protein YczE